MYVLLPISYLSSSFIYCYSLFYPSTLINNDPEVLKSMYRINPIIPFHNLMIQIFDCFENKIAKSIDITLILPTFLHPDLIYKSNISQYFYDSSEFNLSHSKKLVFCSTDTNFAIFLVSSSDRCDNLSDLSLCSSCLLSDY